MTIGAKIPRSNIYLKSDFPLFRERLVSSLVAAEFALDTGIASTFVRIDFFFHIFSRGPADYCFPKLPVYSAPLTFFLSSSSAKWRGAVRARARIFRFGKSRGPSWHYLATFTEKGALSAVRSFVVQRFVTDSRSFHARSLDFSKPRRKHRHGNFTLRGHRF